MAEEKISTVQLFSLIVVFLLGSSLIVGVGLEVKQDTWIAVFLGTITGIGLILFYYHLVGLHPEYNLFEIMEYCFSRWAAIVLSFIYILYFFYLSTRVTRDFTELITVAILPVTPVEVISVTFMLVIAYILYLGLEVLARVTEIFLPYLFFFFLLFIIFLIASGAMELERLQPIVGEGWLPILKALFPSLVTFPFGELIAFTIILPHVTKFQKSGGTVLRGVLVGGMFITICMAMVVTIVGPEVIPNKSFPLLTASRRIALGEFIERVDAIVVFLMLLSALVKVSLFLYCGLKGLEYIFRVPYKYYALPIAIVVSITSNIVALDYAEHLEEGLKFATKFFHPPMQFFIPFVLFIVLFIKRRKKQSQNKGKSLISG